jgi:sister chromatid cohesion protein PDS5
MNSFELTTKLQFKDSIISKNLKTSELCSKLKQLLEQLNKLNQGTTDKSSLATIKKDLFTQLSHKDKYVRILVCCCISAVLRLFAPECPFGSNELKTIFTVFIKQIVNVKDPQNPYFADYYSLLETTCSIKSVILLATLDDADEIIFDMFKQFFEIVK